MSFTEHNVNGLIYDTSDVITAAGSGAVHAFTTRHGGVSPAPYDSLNFADNKGDTSENLLENYRRLGEAVGFDASRAVGCRQIHSDLVRIASEEDAGKILWDDRPYDADGLITNVPNLPLFAYGTDCCVITLYDPTSRSIGAVHAGWRGTASGIALKAAVSMMSCYGADPYTLRAAISPSIGKCCFETDSDVADAFFALLDPAMDERIEKRGDKYHIDLKAINRLWLLRAGIDPSRIDVHPDCTKCHPERYWSHRAMATARRHGGDDLPYGGCAVKRRLSALLCALTLALSLSGCWSGDVSDDSNGDFWEETPPVETDTSSTLTPITSFALPYLQGVTLDPITCPDGMQQTLGALLYEGLFVLDESFAPQNVLCSRYEHNDDCTSYTFYLRDGVSFSDGSSLTASDVLATLRRAQESERYSARFANVASMRASNGALIVNLTRADSTFPALLDIPIVKSGSEKNTVPLGTGPYLFVTDSDGACLKQNPDWRSDGTLPFERIELRAVKDADTASYLFSSREVHLLSADLTSSTGDLRSADTALTDYATANMIYLGFNTQRAPLSDASLRSALAGAIDRATITTGYLAGHAEAARFPLSPHSSLYPTEMASTLASPDLAAALESAGVTENRPRTVTILVSESDSFKVSIADYLSRTLSTDVLTVSVRSLPWSDYLTALQNGNFDLYLGEVRLTANWDISSLARTGGALNYGRYADEQCNTLLDAFSLNETDQTARALYRYLAQSAPIAPIAFKTASVLTPSGLIDGLNPTVSSPFYGIEGWTVHFDKR